MGLFGSLQTASNTLQAMQIGLQVTGNNIANANTDGFIRERVNYAPAPVQEIGNLSIGLGVQVDSITQQLDEYLGEQLRDAKADQLSADIQNDAYKDLERLIGELSSTDLSTALTDFFGSIEDTLNPTSGDALSVRNLAVLEGKQLTSEIQRIEERAADLRNRYDEQIAASVDQINSLAAEVRALNVRITQTEGGRAGASEAGALRTQRYQAVNQLTELVDATVVEQPNGGLSISIGGEFLVFEGQSRAITAESGDGSGEAATRLLFEDTGKQLNVDGGRVHGLTIARDEIVDGFRDDLDAFAGTLIHEFNRVYSQGQGIDGFRTLTSDAPVSDTAVRLDQAGLPFSPEHGEFDITVANDRTGDTATSTVAIKLLDTGSGEVTTLADVAAQLNDVPGLSASIDVTGRLTIATDSDETQFYFSSDTSGFLASAGLNTFFTGSTAEDIAINRELDGIQNAGKFAGSTQGLGSTTGNATLLAGLIDRPLDSLEGATIVEQYDQLVNELAQNSTVAGSVAEGLGTYADTLANEFQAVSGVNIDEEALEMIILQRIYQATGRYISVIQEMLDTLVRL
ncbi:MAG: flagellar hook-associated protein FlgK [Planctomycetota bacterium]